MPKLYPSVQIWRRKGHILDHTPYDSDTTDTNAIDIISGSIRQSEALSLNRNRTIVPYIRLKLATVTPPCHSSHHHNENPLNIKTKSATNTSSTRMEKQHSRRIRKDSQSLANTGVNSLGIAISIVLLLGGCIGIYVQAFSERQ